MTARGILETMGNYVYLAEKLSRAIQNEDREAFRDLVRRYFFSSREFNPDVRQPHIADGVRALEKLHPGASALYDVLCEVVHPNWAGITIFRDNFTELGVLEQGVIISCLAPRHYVSTFTTILKSLFTSIEVRPLITLW